MKAIIAMAKNRVIGKDGGLPWPSIKNDFIWFKEFTTGKKLIVGKNTFDTLPMLKNREIFVLTRRIEELSEIPNQYLINKNDLTGKIITDVSDLDPDIIVAGGAKTYVRLLPYITEFYVTHVNGSYDGDTFMSSFEDAFHNRELIHELDGGHKIIKYSK
jgi:dihydrofolate reductase